MTDKQISVTCEQVGPEPKVRDSVNEGMLRVTVEEDGKGTGKFYDLVAFTSSGAWSYAILMDHEGRLSESPIGKIRVLLYKE